MTKFKYDKALERLEAISAELDGEINDINKVADLVKESSELISKCKKMLRSTKEDIDKTFDEIA